MLRAGGIDDPARSHWDVRPSPRFPTLEFRVTDVCLTVDDAVMVAAVVRALVRTCYAHAVQGETPPLPRVELMRQASWRAARYGLEGDLIDVVGERSLPGPDHLQTLAEFVRPALEEHGEWDLVCALLERVLAEGTGAARQRRACESGRQLEDVVDFVVEATTAPVSA